MAGSVDTSRAPKGELAARALIDSVIATDDRIERHYLEIKSTLDLTTKKDQAKLAKFILGAANRMPDQAANAFEGYGVLVIGASEGLATGVPPIEALDLQKAVLPFIGADGPRYDLVRVPLDGSENEVLVFLVEPPEWGQPPFICHKDGDEKLRNGAVFVRADGETREARADELQQLIQRGQRSTMPVDFAVRVIGTVRPVELDNEATLEEYISLQRNRLQSALERDTAAADDGSITDPITKAVMPTLAAIQQAQSAMRAFSEPEHRSEEEYLASIDDWERHFRAAWPAAVLRLIGGLADPVEVEVNNREKTFFHDVELKVHLDGNVYGAGNWEPSDDDIDLRDLGDFPAPPRPWGPTNKLGLGGVTMPTITPAWHYAPSAIDFPSRTAWQNSGSVDWVYSVGDLRPKGNDVSNDEEFVLYTLDPSMTAVDGTWQITARDHHDVYTGDLQVEIGETLDLTPEVRRILGLEETPA
ncbi:hypothetical protein [Nocardioides sp. KR10-350]|uniref:hypothetical protein n=1 Tax=Nocardioides cheoyonin TaxID=3156615 RepID=UPI0032B5EE0C